jgi:hypothetical protein
MELYWIKAKRFGSRLAELALRLWNTLSTETPSERAVSVMNFIHSCFRNRLSSGKADMEAFMYINTRVLEHMRAGSRSPRFTDLQADQVDDLEKQMYRIFRSALQLHQKQLNYTSSHQDRCFDLHDPI